MATVHNINNHKYIVMDINDILYIIDKECDSELANMLRETITDLKEKANYTSRKLDTDLISYEGSLESYNSMCCVITELLEKLENYVEDSKRLDRNYILQLIHSIEKEVQYI